MCKPGPHFKFCTCDPKDLGENYWRLNRGSYINRMSVVGQWFKPYPGDPFSTEAFLAERIIFDLNNNPVFDFDYNPTEGDTFELQMLGYGKDSDEEQEENSDEEHEDNIWLELIYQNGRFVSMEETGSTSNRNGEELGSGYVSFEPYEEDDDRSG